MSKSEVEVAATVFELPCQHLLGDGQQVDNPVIVDAPRLGHAFASSTKLAAHALSLLNLTQYRMRDALRVKHHGRGRAVEGGIFWHLLGDDLAPLAEPDKH